MLLIYDRFLVSGVRDEVEKLRVSRILSPDLTSLDGHQKEGQAYLPSVLAEGSEIFGCRRKV